MVGERKTVPLGTICQIFDGPHATPVKTAEGPVFLGISCLDHGRLNLDEAEHLSERDFQTWTRRVKPGAGDVVFSYETRIGEAAVIPAGLRCCLGRRMGLLRPKCDLVDPRFLLYAYLGPEVQETLRSRTIHGSTVDRIPLVQMSEFPISLPPIPTQCAIAHILGTLDDKIELNRRMNETLEDIARALFKSWFVDFDPVRAKAEGRDPGLPHHLADLFPDSFVDSELGEIPRGWRIGTLGDEFRLTMGQSPPGETYNKIGTGLPFYQGRADFGFRFPGRRIYCTAPTRFAEVGDTLVSVRAPVGDINVSSEHCAIGRGVAAVRHKSGAQSYTVLVMRSLKDVFARFEGEGTVFGSIAKNDFNAIPITTATDETVRAFEQLAGPLDDRINCNERQICTLSSLRDSLLPKLISGELRIEDTNRNT